MPKFTQKHTHVTRIHTALSYCQQILQDFAYIKKKSKINPNINRIYHVVRYEDMAMKPKQEMDKIYRKMNLKPDPALRNWISGIELKNERGAKTNAGYIYNVDRSNPAYTATAWRFV